MKKRMLLALALALCLVVLCSCQSSNNNQRFTVVTSTNPPQATQNLNMGTPVPAQEPERNFDDGTYDPTSEEGLGDDIPDVIDESGLSAALTPAPTVRGEYAGATPVVIDPIDKPTPTPVPPLTFTYQVYDATRLNLAFEGPVGWTVNDSAADSFTITNPDPAMDYAAALTLTATSVASDMGQRDMENQVEAMLDAIDGTVKSFSPSNTATRTLLDQAGVYANYKAALDDGTEIAGRVHVTCVNKVMYTVHLTYPRAYTETYVDTVYATLRKSINVTQ